MALLLLIVGFDPHHHLHYTALAQVGGDGEVIYEDYAYFSDTTDDTICIDKEEQCMEWALAGECNTNPGYMHVACRKACQLCDHRPFGKKSRYSDEERGSDLGVPQVTNFRDGTLPEDIFFLVGKARSFMMYAAPKVYSAAILDQCQNRNEECAYWTMVGECDRNPTCKSAARRLQTLVLYFK